MLNLKMRAVLLLMPALLLQGCAQKSGDLQHGLRPAMPALPPSARQEKLQQECLPTCSQAWNQQVDEWRKSLTAHGLAEQPASEPMTE